MAISSQRRTRKATGKKAGALRASLNSRAKATRRVCSVLSLEKGEKMIQKIIKIIGEKGRREGGEEQWMGR